MIGMHGSITCNFFRGSHPVGSFLELLYQHQFEAEARDKPGSNFRICHGCVFRTAFGENTSGEMIGPDAGIQAKNPNAIPNPANRVKPHPVPLASTWDDAGWHVIEIQCKLRC